MFSLFSFKSITHTTGLYQGKSRCTVNNILNSKRICNAMISQSVNLSTKQSKLSATLSCLVGTVGSVLWYKQDRKCGSCGWLEGAYSRLHIHCKCYMSSVLIKGSTWKHDYHFFLVLKPTVPIMYLVVNSISMLEVEEPTLITWRPYLVTKTV